MPQTQESVLGQAETLEAIEVKQCTGGKQVLPMTAFDRQKLGAGGILGMRKIALSLWHTREIGMRQTARRSASMVALMMRHIEPNALIGSPW